MPQPPPNNFFKTIHIALSDNCPNLESAVLTLVRLTVHKDDHGTDFSRWTKIRNIISFNSYILIPQFPVSSFQFLIFKERFIQQRHIMYPLERVNLITKPRRLLEILCFRRHSHLPLKRLHELFLPPAQKRHKRTNDLSFVFHGTDLSGAHAEALAHLIIEARPPPCHPERSPPMADGAEGSLGLSRPYTLL